MTRADGVQATTPRVLIPLAIVTLIWGSTWLVIRDQLGVVPATWSVVYRFSIAGLAMLALAAWQRERLLLDARGWLFAGALGLTQMCINFNLVYRAEEHITSGLVATLFAMLVVPNAVLARVFLGQRAGAQFMLGSLVAMAGIALLMLHELRADRGGADDTMLGFALTAGAILMSSISNVMQGTRTARDYPMATVLGWSMLIGVMANAAFAWVTVGPPSFDPRPAYVAGVLYLAIGGSAVAYTLYYGVIRVIGPAKAAYSGVAVPVVAMTLSTLFEDYRWSWLAAGGALLAMAGLVWALSARRPAR